MISWETEMTSVIAELKDELQGIMCVGEEHSRLKIVEKENKRLLNDLTLPPTTSGLVSLQTPRT